VAQHGAADEAAVTGDESRGVAIKNSRGQAGSLPGAEMPG